MSQPYRIEIKDHIAILTIHRPPVNALDSGDWLKLATELDDLGQRSDVKVIVMAGDGKGFCAGVDIKELAKHPERIVEVNRGNYLTFKAIHRNPKPVICALHGYVLGGGIGISGAADLIIASECTRFGVPEIDRGAMGGGAHLQRMFPVQKVRAMYFTGEFIDSQEAYRLGAIEKVVPREELMNATLEVARKIAKKPMRMLELAKESLNGVEDGDLEAKYRWEQGFTLEAYQDQDSDEARDAFVEKRDTQYKN